MRSSRFVFCSALVLAGACSQNLTLATDAGAGPFDAGEMDAGSVDTGTPGAGSVDAGKIDAGSDAGSADAGEPDAGAADAGVDGGTVSYGGGTVNLLDFVLTGDTRPGFCDLVNAYPTAIIQKEILQMIKLPSQFAADLGDHMFACIPNLGSLMPTASAQMQLYVASVSQYPKPFFMTMGNHECLSMLDCSTSLSATDPNFNAYLAALPVVSHQTLPYYSLDVQTSLGLVRLVFIADNYASADAQSWLTSTMADADLHAVHTIILKHHPYTGDTGPSWMWATLAAHRVSLMLTAHEHDYEHDLTALGGRTVICGLGGANTANTGFCRVQQQPDNSLAFTEYDIDGNPLDTWSVPVLPP